MESRLWKGTPSWARGLRFLGHNFSGAGPVLQDAPPGFTGIGFSSSPAPRHCSCISCYFEKQSWVVLSRDKERGKEQPPLWPRRAVLARWAPSRGASAGTMVSGSAARQGCSEGLAEPNGRVHHTCMYACTPTCAYARAHMLTGVQKHTYMQCSVHACSHAHAQNIHTPHMLRTHAHTQNMHACIDTPACSRFRSPRLPGADGPRRPQEPQWRCFPSTDAGSQEGG